MSVEWAQPDCDCWSIPVDAVGRDYFWSQLSVHEIDRHNHHQNKSRADPRSDRYPIDCSTNIGRRSESMNCRSCLFRYSIQVHRVAFLRWTNCSRRCIERRSVDCRRSSASLVAVALLPSQASDSLYHPWILSDLEENLRCTNLVHEDSARNSHLTNAKVEWCCESSGARKEDVRPPWKRSNALDCNLNPFVGDWEWSFADGELDENCSLPDWHR